MLATIISFILIFCLIVVAHEMGHFILAKMNGIRVNEFFIGMGPTLFHFTKGETKYSLKLFPIGGACVFDGENGLEEAEAGADPQREGSFLKASVWARFATIFAGPLFNFILAYILGIIIVANSGTDMPVISSVVEGGQAEAADIMPGDVIKKINRENIHIYRQIYFISYTSKGEALTVTYERDGVENTVALTPKYSAEDGRYLLGVNAYGGYRKCGILETFEYAFYEVEFGMTSTLKSLGMMVRGQLTRDDVAGPVGMAAMVGETYEVTKDYGIWVVILSMLNIAMILSVNLGVMNLLPIPALDGGRLVFFIVEMIRGKPVPPEKEGMVHLAGMIALMLLMVIVLFNDITKFL